MARLIRLLVVLLLPEHVPDLIKFCNAVILAMTNNKWFPTPAPALSIVTAAVAALEQTETLAATKAKGTAEARDADLAIVLTLMHQLKAYVQTIIDANLASLGATIATSASMSLRKVAATRVLVFEAVKGPVSGSVKLSAPGAGPGGSHQWGYGTDGKTFVSAPATTKRSTILMNLTPATLYYFRHRTLTPKNGESEWSQTITLIVT